MAENDIDKLADPIIQKMKEGHHAVWLDPETHASQHEFLRMMMDERAERIARRKAAGRGRPARLRGQDGTEVVLTDALIDQIDDAITVAVQAQWDRYWQRVDAVQAATTVAQVNAVGW